MNASQRTTLLASAAIAAACAAPTSAQTASTTVTSTPTTGTPSATPSTTPDRPVAALNDKVAPQWGKIRSFWGDASPFWGNIRSFWGDAGPYSDDLSPFWGKIRSFNDTNTDSVLQPSWGKIRSFAGDVGASWGKIRSFWGNIRSFSDAPGDYGALSTMIQGMVDQSQATFGDAVQTQSGRSFKTAFADPMLAKYGIDLANPSSLQNLDASRREQFFMDWYDNLMNYSGADHVDHWMKEVNWTPSLTQTLGSGRDTTIGILDFSIAGEASTNVVKYAGVSTVANGHGDAVASLIVDPMDGKGVMGIAPSASVISFNPFDATQTAGWADIATGVAMLTKNGATIINMSLGVPGWTLNGGWNDVFQNSAVKKPAQRQVFVIAAGNDGVSQTHDVVWKSDNPQFIVVGSVDPNGVISSFSNTPGTACLTDDKGKCSGNMLASHFIVAPGEMILVSDGAGGTTRMSGTSFAAPLVSGTVALIQDRWPWLTDHPKDVVGIIFKSAKDLGAPGVDPVYGYGELDVQAALSPISWANLKFKQVVNGKTTDFSLANLMTAATTATRASWEANSVYFTLFEDTGESYRDFAVPVSSKLENKTMSVDGRAEQFMSYLSSRFLGVLGAPKSLADGSTTHMQFTDLRGVSGSLASFGDIQASFSMRPSVNRIGFQASDVPFETSMRIASSDLRLAAEFGNGQSATSLGAAGFGMTSDYDPSTGGANPFLGFASGGSYAKVAYALATELSVTAGATQRRLVRDLNGLPLELRQALATSPYAARAVNVAVSYAPSSTVTTSVSYSMLHENEAVLGMGSRSALGPNGGSTTDSATVSADFAISPTLSLSASATGGRTRAGDSRRELFAIGRGGLLSTAFQLAAVKQRVFGASDSLRLSMAQPLHVESGSVDVSMLQVVDRDTGALGMVTQTVGITRPQRRYVAEMIYGRPMLGGRAQLSMFGRANLNAQATDDLPGVTAGTSMRLAF